MSARSWASTASRGTTATAPTRAAAPRHDVRMRAMAARERYAVVSCHVERPLGHHTHWTAPDHARPPGGDPGSRVLDEGHMLRKLGLRPTLFCGGGWYADVAVAEACADLGYVDCTATSYRPPYLPPGAP